MTLALVHNAEPVKRWTPQKSPDHGHCETITRCIASLHGFGMTVAKEIVEPGQHEGRRLAVVIAADMDIPQDVICEFFRVGTPSRMRDGSGFGATYNQALEFCRRCTGKAIQTEPVL